MAKLAIKLILFIIAIVIVAGVFWHFFPR